MAFVLGEYYLLSELFGENNWFCALLRSAQSCSIPSCYPSSLVQLNI